MANPFEKLNRDELFSIALEFDLPDLLKFCNLETRINDLICEQKDIWFRKIKSELSEKDYTKDENFIKQNPKRYYIGMYLKEKLKYSGSVQELLNAEELKLINNKLKEIPKEIGKLTNLRKLDLGMNQLKEIPKEIGNLTNLNYLSLWNNELTEIPKELGNLTNLQELRLGYNKKLKEIPQEIKKIKGLIIYR